MILEKSIIATLNYFDIFEYPLTLFEIKKNLINLNNNKNNFSLIDIENVLNNEELNKKIEQKNGFYFLKGKSHYLTRQKRYYFANKKFKRVMKIAWLFSKIPFIKMIAVCNSLGYSNSRDDSDIDFFIITSKNRIWSARFLSVFLIKLLNLRPKKGKVKNTICMPFFVDEENLNLEKFKISQNDIYLKFWITQLSPVYIKDNIYEKFFNENKWIENFLPNRIRNKPVQRRKILPKKQKIERKYLQVNFLEKFSKKIQLKFMDKSLRDLMNKDTRVVIGDGVLKLFAVDRREEYMNMWMKSYPESP